MKKIKCCDNDCKTVEEVLDNHLPKGIGKAWAHACDDPDCILCDKGLTADLG